MAVNQLQRETYGLNAHAFAQAKHEAVIAIGHAVRKQATIMGYSDAFVVLGGALVIALLLAMLLKKHGGPVSADGAH